MPKPPADRPEMQGGRYGYYVPPRFFCPYWRCIGAVTGFDSLREREEHWLHIHHPRKRPRNPSPRWRRKR